MGFRSRQEMLSGALGMDGRLAVFFWLMSIPVSNDPQAEGVNAARADFNHRLTLTQSALQYQNKFIGYETRATFSFDQLMGRFNPVLDLSLSNKGAVWAGAGLYQQLDLPFGDHTFFAGFSFIPGLYFKGNDVDLGHTVEFRSGIEFGYRADNGLQFSISYDHRSNAELGRINPGLESVAFRVSKSLY